MGPPWGGGGATGGLKIFLVEADMIVNNIREPQFRRASRGGTAARGSFWEKGKMRGNFGGL